MPVNTNFTYHNHASWNRWNSYYLDYGEKKDSVWWLVPLTYRIATWNWYLRHGAQHLGMWYLENTWICYKWRHRGECAGLPSREIRNRIKEAIKSCHKPWHDDMNIVPSCEKIPPPSLAVNSATFLFELGMYLFYAPTVTRNGSSAQGISPYWDCIAAFVEGEKPPLWVEVTIFLHRTWPAMFFW